MSLSPQEQFKEFLDKSREVLILIPENPSGDAVGSAWALYSFLSKKNINPSIAFSNHLSSKFDFLPKPQNIVTEISGARDFVLSFDTTRNKIKNIRHEEKDGQFNIFLTPEKGAIDPRDFSFILAKFKYDLIVVFDSPDLEKLGTLYETNPDLFFEVPIVNIDHRSSNDNFGQINMVDVTASSCSEILFNVLESISPELIDQNMADCLLTGIISATDSFQKKNTTPRAFLTAAVLMDKGADQQQIIRWLYKTQPLNVLKLWGRVMAKLNWDSESRLVWSQVSVEDFVQSRSNPESLGTILDKLEENYSEAKTFMLAYGDTPTSCVALIKTSVPEKIHKVQEEINGQIKNDILRVAIPECNLEEASKIMAKKIKEIAF